MGAGLYKVVEDAVHAEETTWALGLRDVVAGITQVHRSIITKPAHPADMGPNYSVIHNTVRT